MTLVIAGAVVVVLGFVLVFRLAWKRPPETSLFLSSRRTSRANPGQRPG